MTDSTPHSPNSSPSPTRRSFLGTSGALMAAAIAVPTVLTRSRALAGTVPPPSPSESKGKAIRIGVIGCGGRGTGAAFDALKASPDTTIVALGDLFPDRVQGAAAGLAKNPRGVVPSSACFSGFDAYRKVLATDCDMVILATSPGFRPTHFAAAFDQSANRLSRPGRRGVWPRGSDLVSSRRG